MSSKPVGEPQGSWRDEQATAMTAVAQSTAATTRYGDLLSEQAQAGHLTYFIESAVCDGRAAQNTRPHISPDTQSSVKSCPVTTFLACAPPPRRSDKIDV